MVLGIVLAAGNGRRFGGQKQFTKIGTSYIFEFSLRVALETLGNNHVILVLPKDTPVEILAYCTKNYSGAQIVFGGRNRLYSIQNALKHIHRKYMPVDLFTALIDSSRPLLKKKMLKTIIQKAIADNCNYIITKKITDFLVATKNTGKILPINRSGHLLSHTPHVYKFTDIFESFSQSPLDQELDSAILLVENGFEIKSLDISSYDLKITYNQDLKILEKLI